LPDPEERQRPQIARVAQTIELIGRCAARDRGEDLASITWERGAGSDAAEKFGKRVIGALCSGASNGLLTPLD
jgi:hypothetical protein